MICNNPGIPPMPHYTSLHLGKRWNHDDYTQSSQGSSSRQIQVPIHTRLNLHDRLLSSQYQIILYRAPGTACFRSPTEAVVHHQQKLCAQECGSASRPPSPPNNISAAGPRRDATSGASRGTGSTKPDADSRGITCAASPRFGCAPCFLPPRR